MEAYPDYKQWDNCKIVIDEREIRTSYMERQSGRQSLDKSI